MLNMFELLDRADRNWGNKRGLSYRGEHMRFAELCKAAVTFAGQLAHLGLRPHDRVALFMEKRPGFVTCFFGVARAGGVVVPLNPQMRAGQVGHVLNDCMPRFLVTTRSRLESVGHAIPPGVEVLFVDEMAGEFAGELIPSAPALSGVETDPAAILYTSGSTGLPKGVVLSHRNLIAGAESVNAYLENTQSDVILSLLPLSFDAGLSQLTCAVAAGARLILLNYLNAKEAVAVCEREGVTSITGVPPLWHQLAEAKWSEAASQSVRVFANTGGHMPLPLLTQLRRRLPQAKPYLMYGLTEAFRSTYLDPSQIDARPDSMGKAVPNAEVLVLRSDGSLCDPHEPGELVHRGAFVTLGYFNDEQRTREKFRPLPNPFNHGLSPEIAVWSGDIVRRDEEGFLYFIGRNDEMIKTSGYRVSPTELEEVLRRAGLRSEVAVIGAPHPVLGQAILAIMQEDGENPDDAALLAACRRELPSYMIPHGLVRVPSISRNLNGKLDRAGLKAQYSDYFQAESDGLAATRLPNLADRLEAPEYGHQAVEARDAGLQTASVVVRELPIPHAEPQASVAAAQPAALSELRRQLAQILGVDTARDEDTFVGLGGDSLNYVRATMLLDSWPGGSPEGWEHMPFATLEARLGSQASLLAPGDSSAQPTGAGAAMWRAASKDRRLKTLESSVVLRALAIVVVVYNHIINGRFGGAANALLLIAGMNFARFQLSRLGAGRSREVFQATLLRVALPYFLVLTVEFLIVGRVFWPQYLLYSNFTNGFVWEGLRRFKIYWFVEVYLSLIFVFCGLFLIPQVRALSANRPKVTAIGTFLAAVLAAVLAQPYSEAGYIYIHTPMSAAYIFVFGWMIETLKSRTEKFALLAVGALVLLLLPLQREPLAAPILGLAVIVLLFVRKIPMGPVLAKPLSIIAGASFYIYILHGMLLAAARDMFGHGELLPPWSITPILSGSVVLGLAGWWAADLLTSKRIGELLRQARALALRH